jgi:methylaspartate mutase sigma subunit
MGKGKIVIGTIGSDSHSIGQWVLAKYLEEKGFDVIKLGICVSQQEFLEAVIETDADAVCVSSLYGMGYQDSLGIRERFIEGGSENEWAKTEEKFKRIGFDRVYSRRSELEEVARAIEADLKNKMKERKAGNQIIDEDKT